MSDLKLNFSIKNQNDLINQIKEQVGDKISNKILQEVKNEVQENLDRSTKTDTKGITVEYNEHTKKIEAKVSYYVVPVLDKMPKSHKLPTYLVLKKSFFVLPPQGLKESGVLTQAFNAELEKKEELLKTSFDTIIEELES